MFAERSRGGHPDVTVARAVPRAFMTACYSEGVTDAWLQALAQSPWALPAMAALVVGDAFLVVIPGEAAVTTLGALAVAEGSPPLAAVIVVAAAAALTGDLGCYLVGRTAGLERWRWMRGPRVAAALGGARTALHRRGATLMFTARFIPFARLAVNLVAGASRMPMRRYLLLAAPAASAWALYQALLGAAVAALIPGGTVAAVIASVVVAIALGAAADAIVARAQRRRAPDA
ncbi:DedA family protein [uncultured Microbacterium sp.]|uniref:DedA family protein n=1 Tax=uncultured Microbacterium sp. TaxID=191216 RepID=UPI0025DAE19A|nr:VTT domain-containing protein [uncultured Microbacterium sp.]